MKSLYWTTAFIALIGFSGCADQSKPNESLAPIAALAMAEGTDAQLNVQFARILGFQADEALSLKRLQIEEDGATNILNVLRDDPNKLILSERRQSLTTFYLTDQAGKLIRVVVNDSSITNGGLTNLAPSDASTDFARQKQIWIQRNAR